MVGAAAALLVERATSGDVRALARLLTRVEDGGPEAEALLARVYPRGGRARVIGLTGPPGVGKSSLTDRLTAHYRARGRTVAVVAVDPSSPFTGGAILGDRIRMAAHFTDPGVFIRSMATRGHTGGLSAATADAVDVLDAAGYEVVLVETVGVGQEDIEVTRLVPVCLLVLTPGLGDDVQVMKSGIMEVGDVFVINKADLAGAERVESALRGALSGAGLEEQRPVVRTVAATGEGVAELAAAAERVETERTPAEREEHALRRARARVSAIVSAALEERLRRALERGRGGEKPVEQVARRELDPYAAARALLAGAGL